MPARSYRKYRKKLGAYLFMMLSLLHNGCVEEFEPETEFFESALVIESVVTDEVKPQEIVLSRTFRFEENGPRPEQNAKVRIIDNDEIEYTFTEVEPGRYLSTDIFGALPEKEYRLIIDTDDGTRYNSDASKLTGAADIENVYAVSATNQNNGEGVSFRIDTFDPTGNSRYYRFDYAETYKIIAPKWAAVDAVVVDGSVTLLPKTREQKTCYNTVLSRTINLASTKGIDQDRLTGFPVRFIEKDNFIIAHRYSILVRQYVISPEAFRYYTYLADLSASESIFSESQPGFLAGNVFSDKSDEKVLGYFEISAVTSKRIFFNHTDLFPDDSSLSYANSCELAKPEFLVARSLLESGDAKFFTYNTEPGEYEGPYNLVSRVCGDCTVLGDNVVPDFWEE